MAQFLVEKLNKEVRTLRRDVSEIKAILLRALVVPEESLKSYKNSVSLKKAFKRAIEMYPRT